VAKAWAGVWQVGKLSQATLRLALTNDNAAELRQWNGLQAATRHATSACNSCVEYESLLRLNEGQHDANGLDAILFTDHAAPKATLAAKHHGLGSRYAIVYFVSIAKNLSTTALPNPQSGCSGLEDSGLANMGKLNASQYFP
jgi:hypothetical protein